MYTVTPNAIRGAAAGALALGALLAPTAASAVVVAGIELPSGATLEVATIYENVVTGLGDELDGVGIVEIIRDGNGNAVWQSGDNGRELTFVFDSYIVSSIEIASGGGSAVVEFTGGRATFFSDSSPDFDVSGTAAQGFATAGDGEEFLNVVGADIGATPGVTLRALINIVGTDLATIQSGSGTGLLNVDTSGGGAANVNFDTNTLPGGQDLSFSSGFDNVAPAQAFPLSGDSAFRANVIPEPSTLGLFGIGLIGLGFAARRRRQR